MTSSRESLTLKSTISIWGSSLVKSMSSVETITILKNPLNLKRNKTIILTRTIKILPISPMLFFTSILMNYLTTIFFSDFWITLRCDYFFCIKRSYNKNCNRFFYIIPNLEKSDFIQYIQGALISYKCLKKEKHLNDKTNITRSQSGI